VTIPQLKKNGKQVLYGDQVLNRSYIFMSLRTAADMLSHSANNQTSFRVCVRVVYQGLQALWICFPAEGCWANIKAPWPVNSNAFRQGGDY